LTRPTSSHEWDASAYHQISGPQASWGEKVLSRLNLTGDETILDAGCGTGRLTAGLLDNLPRGRVLALDISQNMLKGARSHLGPRGHAKLHFVCADLGILPFCNSLDGIFSTASFHWVLDHARLFQNLFMSLRPGGWLVAQCGEARNLNRLRNRIREIARTPPYANFLSKFGEPWFFSDAEGAYSRLKEAGFVDIETSAEPASTPFENSAHYTEFVRTAIVHRHLSRLPGVELRQSFLQDLAEQAAQDDPPFELDYWRLNLKARKP